MKFNLAPNTNYSVERYLSEDKVWEVFIYRVMFGYRVQVCAVGSCYLLVNYCCRDDANLLVATLATCLSRLSQIKEPITEQKILQVLPEGKDKLFRDRELLEFLDLGQFYEEPSYSSL